MTFRFYCCFSQLSEMIRFMVVQTLSKEDIDRLNVSKLFIEFHNASLLPYDVFMNVSIEINFYKFKKKIKFLRLLKKGFNVILENLSDLESEFHFVKSNISLYAARAVCDGVITFHELACEMKHGAYYPLFFLCMQNMHKIKSQDWLRQQLEKSKINLIDMLPSKLKKQLLVFNDNNEYILFRFCFKDGDRSKERLIQILEDRELGFLYPMLKIETALLEKIQNNCTSDELKEWICVNLNSELTNSIDFIQSLVTW